MCWIFHETLPIWLPIRCPFKKIVYASWKVLKICLRASKRWLWSFRKSVSHFPREQLLHDLTIVLKFRDIERFLLTWPAYMQIYENKRKCLHKKRDQIPKDWFGTPTWLPFYCFGNPIWPPWRHVKTLYSGLYRAFSHDVTSAILVFQTKGTVAILVFQTSPVGVKSLSFFFYSFHTIYSIYTSIRK